MDVSWLMHPDLAVVGALARLQLAARRDGVSLRLHQPCPLLLNLLVLTGLDEAIRRCECGDRAEAFDVPTPDDG